MEKGENVEVTMLETKDEADKGEGVTWVMSYSSFCRFHKMELAANLEFDGSRVAEVSKEGKNDGN